MLVLIGVLIVVIGFVLCFNVLLVVMIVGFVMGFVGGLNFVDIVSVFGKVFIENCYMGLIWFMLLVIVLFECNGFKE